MSQFRKKSIAKRTRAAIVVCIGASLSQAQAPTMKQLMLDLIHPAANDLILAVNRGGPSNDTEWAEARRNAMALAASGNSLITQMDLSDWKRAAKQLSDAGEQAYKAAQSRDRKSLTAATSDIDASCTNCHKQFRPNVFPRQGA